MKICQTGLTLLYEFFILGGWQGKGKIPSRDGNILETSSKLLVNALWK